MTQKVSRILQIRVNCCAGPTSGSHRGYSPGPALPRIASCPRPPKKNCLPRVTLFSGATIHQPLPISHITSLVHPCLALWKRWGTPSSLRILTRSPPIMPTPLLQSSSLAPLSVTWSSLPGRSPGLGPSLHLLSTYWWNGRKTNAIAWCWLLHCQLDWIKIPCERMLVCL